jgi:hypothetical protein
MENTAMESVGSTYPEVGQSTKPSPSSLTGLTEHALSNMKDLQKAISLLENKLEIVCQNIPEEVDPGRDYEVKEPELNRPDEKITKIDIGIVRCIKRIERLSSRLNI